MHYEGCEREFGAVEPDGDLVGFGVLNCAGPEEEVGLLGFYEGGELR